MRLLVNFEGLETTEKAREVTMEMMIMDGPLVMHQKMIRRVQTVLGVRRRTSHPRRWSKRGVLLDMLLMNTSPS
ncbi:hypothetical protein N665_0123s0039 [Sinapis alba]|nr:hypothetical protein N665_0123s0039 [Sinapis alba]